MSSVGHGLATEPAPLVARSGCAQERARIEERSADLRYRTDDWNQRCTGRELTSSEPVSGENDLRQLEAATYELNAQVETHNARPGR